jgi:hypothetical protein
MSTAQEVRTFAQPFVQGHDGLVMIKRDVVRTPVTHCLAGVHFRESPHRGEIAPRWYLSFLFAPPPRSRGGFAGAMDHAWGILGSQGLKERVFGEMERVFAEVIPPQTSLATALNVHEHTSGGLGGMRPESRALLNAALGEFELAQAGLHVEIERQRQLLERELSRMAHRTVKPSLQVVQAEGEANVANLDLLLAALKRGRPDAVASILHEWEAIAVQAWGVERYWQPSPFPFELT